MLNHMIAAAMLLAQSTPTPPSAAESDPVRLQLMQGHPVPAARQVRWDTGNMWAFPQTRWAFSHIRELMPTVGIQRGRTVQVLPRSERNDLDAVRLTTMDGREMSWRESLDATYTDGIVVLHRGRIVYERYLGALQPTGQHIAFSVTKSFVGTLAETLIAEGQIDPSRRVDSYLPELSNSGFADATVRQLMDMRTNLAYDESYTGMGRQMSDITRQIIAVGWVPAPENYQGPVDSPAYAASIGRAGDHGGRFTYATPNSVVLTSILERVTGQSLAAQIQSRYWSRLGMEQDAALTVDRLGTAFGGGGLLASLRDLARFGEMIRRGGRWNGEQIVPRAAIDAIMRGGSTEAFAEARYPGLEGGNYGSQWWHRASGQVLALGIHGQGIYIDPAAELVIARFASHPTASNRGINPVTIPAYDALTRRLTVSRGRPGAAMAG
jgi:CubicO group peptidase (beta-lactamase class C family)